MRLKRPPGWLARVTAPSAMGGYAIRSGRRRLSVEEGVGRLVNGGGDAHDSAKERIGVNRGRTCLK